MVDLGRLELPASSSPERSNAPFVRNKIILQQWSVNSRVLRDYKVSTYLAKASISCSSRLPTMANIKKL
jgi:hypothetical protein